MDFLRRRTITGDIPSPPIPTLYNGGQVSTGERGKLAGQGRPPGGPGGFFWKILRDPERVVMLPVFFPLKYSREIFFDGVRHGFFCCNRNPAKKFPIRAGSGRENLQRFHNVARDIFRLPGFSCRAVRAGLPFTWRTRDRARRGPSSIAGTGGTEELAGTDEPVNRTGGRLASPLSVFFRTRMNPHR